MTYKVKIIRKKYKLSDKVIIMKLRGGQHFLPVNAGCWNAELCISTIAHPCKESSALECWALLQHKALSYSKCLMLTKMFFFIDSVNCEEKRSNLYDKKWN